MAILGWLKQLAFGAFVYSGYPAVRDFCRGLLGRAPVVVLCYHRVGGQGILSKTPPQFARDLEFLKQNYECISLKEFCERVRSGKKFHRRCAIVTFDDGYKDNFTAAVPVLRRVGIPATFFVTTGFIGTEKMFAHDTRAMSESVKRYGAQPTFEKLSWDDLRKMQDLGFEIGSHTVNHADFSTADAQAVEREVRDSLATLQKELGESPRSFAYPWGTEAHVSEAIVNVIRDCRYFAAVTMFPGTNTSGQDVYRIRRIDAGNGNLTPLAFKAKIAGLAFGRSRSKSEEVRGSRAAVAKS